MNSTLLQSNAQTVSAFVSQLRKRLLELAGYRTFDRSAAKPSPFKKPKKQNNVAPDLRQMGDTGLYGKDKVVYTGETVSFETQIIRDKVEVKKAQNASAPDGLTEQEIKEGETRKVSAAVLLIIKPHWKAGKKWAEIVKATKVAEGTVKKALTSFNQAQKAEE